MSLPPISHYCRIHYRWCFVHCFHATATTEKTNHTALKRCHTTTRWSKPRLSRCSVAFINRFLVSLATIAHYCRIYYCWCFVNCLHATATTEKTNHTAFKRCHSTTRWPKPRLPRCSVAFRNRFFVSLPPISHYCRIHYRWCFVHCFHATATTEKTNHTAFKRCHTTTRWSKPRLSRCSVAFINRFFVSLMPTNLFIIYYRWYPYNMGILGSNDLLWRSVPLPLDKIIYLIIQQFYRNNQPHRPYPVAVLDANLLGFKIPRSIAAAKGVFIIAKEFAKKGIAIVILADNKLKRHHTKRATVKRQCLYQHSEDFSTAERIPRALQRNSSSRWWTNRSHSKIY